MSGSLPSTPIKGNGASQRASIASSRPLDDDGDEQQLLLPPNHKNHHHQNHHTEQPQQHEESPASHFFTSVLSAAQNAASSLTGLKGNGSDNEAGRQRSMSDPSEFFQNYDDRDGPSLNVEREASDSPAPAHGVNDVVIEPIRSAISTLGKGELSLASLGLAEEGNEQTPVNHNSMFSQRDDEDEAEEDSLLSDTKSLMETGSLKENHRSRKNTTDSAGIGAEFNQGGALAVPIMSRSKSRASSLISKQRKRRSSSTEDEEEEVVTGARRSTNRITGFAYANKKRNKDFHRLFRSVTTDDYLLDDFSCALSREILIHGRLYVSEKHVCFNSNILGWVTNLIIGFDEIVTLEKKNTAGLFPNGIIIQTLHARHSFASFVSRDTTLEFLTSVWKQASPHQARLEGGNSMLNLAGDDFDYKSSDEDEEDDDEDEDDSERNNTNNSANNLDEMAYESDEGASLGSFGSTESLFTDDGDDDNVSEVQEEAVQTEDSPAQPSQTTANNTTTGGGESGGGNGGWPVGNLGPDTHSATDPGDPESKGEKLLANELIPAPLGVVCNLLFGEDTSFMKRLIVDVQKNTDLNDYSSFGKESTRKYEYIKPLNGPVGPKQTRCICTDTVEEWDLEKRVVVVTATQTPDVPSGGSFVTKSRYSLAWGESNQTKLLFSFWTEWSGKSWIKGAIERGSQDGQTQFSKDLISEINTLLKGAKKRKATGKGKKPSKAKKTKKQRRPEDATTTNKATTKDERMAGVVKRIGEIMNTEISSLLPVPIWGITIIVLIIYIFVARPNVAPQTTPSGKDSLSSMMLEEEYEVWRWIDDRVAAKPNSQYKPPASQDIETAYGKQELAESIRITQHRLNLLKDKLDI